MGYMGISLQYTRSQILSTSAGTIGLSLGFRVEGLGLNNRKKALCDADLGTVRLSSGGPGIFVFHSFKQAPLDFAATRGYPQTLNPKHMGAGRAGRIP